MKVTIVGAGFSGLTLAYYLTKHGAAVEIFEKQNRSGGLLQTKMADFGLVESAANGLLNSVLVEALFTDVGVKFAPRQKTRTRRYIFRQRPRRWPLSLMESSNLIFRLVSRGLSGGWRPRPQETVAQWGNRVGGPAFSRYLLAPALQGVYAGDARRMSAELILGRRKKPDGKPRLRGTVAPVAGMGQLIEHLTAWLKSRGVSFRWEQEPERVNDALVVATSAWDAAAFLATRAPDVAAVLAQVEALPLVTATLGFVQPPAEHRGFGCLFPEHEQFQSLGVLFNSDIFDGRGGRSETWILGGALRPGSVELSDDEIQAKILADRQRLFGNSSRPTGSMIHRWPKALPHYTVEWRNALTRLRLPPGLHLTGNYLGAIGLTRILQFNRDLAAKLHA